MHCSAVCRMKLSYPIFGAAIGLGVGNTYHEGSKAALGTQGTLDAIAGGILIYVRPQLHVPCTLLELPTCTPCFAASLRTMLAGGVHTGYRLLHMLHAGMMTHGCVARRMRW